MPRKKLIRRFEPRYGVNQEMINTESKYVAREFDDHMLLSIDDLSKSLAQLRERCRQSDEMTESLVRGLSERESLAMQCLIVRDFFHLLELYCHCLRSMQLDRPEAPAPAPQPRTKRQEKPVKEEKKMVPFSEWLFGNPS